MGDRTGIEWTDATWNPLLGCSHVSPGCDNCYAAREASGRLRHSPGYSGLARDGRFTGQIRLMRDRLSQPIRWRRPRRIFVNSMSDLFHPDVPYDFQVEVFAVMAAAPQHIYQVLTKRPQRMASVLTDTAGETTFLREVRQAFEDWAPPQATLADLWTSWPLPHVWLGTSIESNRYAFRADHLRRTPAAVRWLSLEPLLGPLDQLNLEGIDWVVVGGESGPGARPVHPDWVRDIRDRCVTAGIPFHFKQWGEWAPAAVRDDPTFYGGRVFDDPRGGRCAPVIRERGPSRTFRSGRTRPMEPGDETMKTTMFDHDTVAVKVGKRRSGRQLDGREWDEYPA